MAPLAERLARIGGVLLHPRRTFHRLLEAREGSLFELLPWAMLAVFTASPIETGRALLLLRVGVLEGAMALLMLFAHRIMADFAGIIGAAALLHVLERIRWPRDQWYGFDRLIDACAYAVFPHFLLMSCSGLVATLGFERWWMPHLSLKGVPWVLWSRLAVSFAWSAILGVVLAHVVWRGPRINSERRA